MNNTVSKSYMITNDLKLIFSLVIDFPPSVHTAQQFLRSIPPVFKNSSTLQYMFFFLVWSFKGQQNNNSSLTFFYKRTSHIPTSKLI